MEFEDLEVQTRGQIVTIALARPDARNAYSEAMVRSIVEALARAQRDEEVRCVVLTGRGSAFSAGGDLKLMRDHAGMFEGGPSELRRRYMDGIQGIPGAILRFEKPLIAAINGPAIGAGLDLACMCDLRIASEDAKFGSTFVKVGLVPGDGGAYFLTRAVGYARALDLMLTARVIDAQEALSIGLVQRVVTADALLEEADALAARICDNAPVAVRLTKRAAVLGYDADASLSLELAATYQGIAQNTADHDEAVDAFLERRAPTFKGR